MGNAKKISSPVATRINESRLEIEITAKDGGTSKIVLRGWESIEGLRGQKFHFLVVDEVAMMRNFWVGWQEVLRPALTDTRGHVLFISTPKGFNHFYDLFCTNDEDYQSFHFTTYDNPFIPADEVDKARLELPEDKFHQEYMADFRKMEGLVYKEFNREQHLFNKAPSFKAVIAGQDFGYTNPFAAVVIGIDRDDCYWVLDEKYQRERTTAEIIDIDKILQKEHNINYWYCDPAEPDRIEEMRRAGLNCRDVSKNVEAGISHIHELFKAGRIKIHDSCQNLISELESYRYEDDKPDKNSPEKPVKEHDHAVDALRYALYNHQPEPKQEYYKQPEWEESFSGIGG